MGKIIQCRSCGNPYQIKPKIFQNNEYEDGIKCFDCWDKESGRKSTTVTVNNSSKSSSGFSNWNNIVKYDVGDSVFINTDKKGVLLCQILDVECYGDKATTYYTLDIAGRKFDLLTEDDLFDSYEEANKSSFMTVI